MADAAELDASAPSPSAIAANSKARAWHPVDAALGEVKVAPSHGMEAFGRMQPGGWLL